MPDKFLKHNGEIYMRVAEMSEGKLDVTALAGLSLAMEDMQRLLEVALRPEPAAQGETAQLLTRKQLAAHLGTSCAHIMAMEKIGLPCGTPPRKPHSAARPATTSPTSPHGSNPTRKETVNDHQ